MIHYENEKHRVRVELDSDCDSPDSFGNTEVFLACEGPSLSVRVESLPDRIGDTTLWDFRAVYRIGDTLSFTGWARHQIGWSTVRRSALVKAGPGPSHESLLEEWNAYLGGDVWGVVVDKAVYCTCKEHHDWEVEDSFWGIYGEEAASGVATAFKNQLA
jgi:hypothetical protein